MAGGKNRRREGDERRGTGMRILLHCLEGGGPSSQEGKPMHVK